MTKSRLFSEIRLNSITKGKHPLFKDVCVQVRDNIFLGLISGRRRFRQFKFEFYSDEVEICFENPNTSMRMSIIELFDEIGEELILLVNGKQEEFKNILTISSNLTFSSKGNR